MPSCWAREEEGPSIFADQSPVRIFPKKCAVLSNSREEQSLPWTPNQPSESSAVSPLSSLPSPVSCTALAEGAQIRQNYMRTLCCSCCCSQCPSSSAGYFLPLKLRRQCLPLLWRWGFSSPSGKEAGHGGVSLSTRKQAHQFLHKILLLII